MDFNLELIVKVAIKAIRETQLFIQREIQEDPTGAFEEVLLGRRNKPLLAVDLIAEKNTARTLRKRLKNYRPLAIGEESLRDPNLDLSNEKKLVVLMDMVDGTDLLERGLFNWCSAMVFYYPPNRKILASFVGLPEDGVYFATDHEDSAYKYRFHEEPRIVKVSGPSDVRSLNSASIAFYGQKVPNFLSVYKHKRFLSRLGYLHSIHKRKKLNLKTRIYNLAGNPMMMRLIDGHKKIDAVFDIEGQAPHDVVPGAYIAQKAKAVFTTLDRHPIDFHKILIKPAHLDSHIQYVLASSEALCQEILQQLCSKN